MDLFGAKHRAAAKRKTEGTDAAMTMMQVMTAPYSRPLTQAEEIAQVKKSMEDAKRDDGKDFLDPA